MVKEVHYIGCYEKFGGMEAISDLFYICIKFGRVSGVTITIQKLFVSRHIINIVAHRCTPSICVFITVFQDQ